MDSTTEFEAVLKTPSPFTSRSSKTSNCGSHSKGLFTPCRRVGLRRKSLKNINTPSNVENDSKLSTTPKSISAKTEAQDSLFVSPKENRNRTNKLDVMENEDTIPIDKNCNSQFLTTPENFGTLKTSKSLEILRTSRSLIFNSPNGNYKHSTECSDTKDFVSNIMQKNLENTDIQEYKHEMDTSFCNGSVKEFCSDFESVSNHIVHIRKKKCITINKLPANKPEGYIAKCNSDNFENYEKCSKCQKMKSPNSYIKNMIKAGSKPAKTIADSSEFTEENLRILKQRIKHKEAEVERLRLVHLYKRKHDVNELSTVIAKWKEGCQEALQRLLQASVTQGHQFDMTQLLEKLSIPPHAVGYNPDTDDFI